jgi:hypothetical protein
MRRVEEQLADLFAACLASGSPPFDAYVARAIEIFVEDICAGAVVQCLAHHIGDPQGPIPSSPRQTGDIFRWVHDGIPIAHVPRTVADEVAQRLASETRCDKHKRRDECCGTYTRSGYSFAAAIVRHAGKVELVLASAACEVCEDDGYTAPGEDGPPEDCPDCSGTGARTDVLAVAERYGEATGTPRLARVLLKT